MSWKYIGRILNAEGCILELAQGRLSLASSTELTQQSFVLRQRLFYQSQASAAPMLDLFGENEIEDGN